VGAGGVGRNDFSAIWNRLRKPRRDSILGMPSWISDKGSYAIGLASLLGVGVTLAVPEAVLLGNVICLVSVAIAIFAYRDDLLGAFVWLRRGRKTKARPESHAMVAISVILFGIIIPIYSLTHLKITEAIPEVSLQFILPLSPAITINNESKAVARNIKYFPLIWNLDDLGDMNPLQIPTGEFDWLKPGGSSIGIPIFQKMLDQGRIKDGDRLVGSLSLTCPTCLTDRSYFVYIEWSKGGWYYDISEATRGRQILPPCHTSKECFEQYLSNAEDFIKEGDRIRIKDPDTEYFKPQAP
jgi:hypothetical protein